MGDSDHVLLTGATGCLGRYLLRDLLASGWRVAVLVRATRSQTAAERIAALRQQLEIPATRRLTTLAGDLGAGLDQPTQGWLRRHCRQVVHAAALTSLRGSQPGAHWQSNVAATQHLLDICGGNIAGFHHVSTAFVSGDRPGIIREDELECGQSFHNDYEASKYAAEKRVRRFSSLRATVYRPSVIVGDSRTGYTSSYQGFYRFLELADRLASPSTARRRELVLRLPFTGAEPRNLIPVDWVAQAIVSIVSRPALHGRTYHLVADTPVPANDIKDIAEQVLGIDGVVWAGRGPLQQPSRLEELFLDQLREYWPYFAGDPVFDSRNTRAALPQLPPPAVNRAMLARLIRFAVSDNWGHGTRAQACGRKPVDCARYMEEFLPASARQSTLVHIPLNTTVALDVRGDGGGQWTCRWRDGQLQEVKRGLRENSEFTYRTNVATFAAIVQGRQSPHKAFFDRQIEIHGNVEKALKLAVLLDQFVKEFPYECPAPAEVCDVSA
jgi:thioester reductase-like protein